MSKPRPPLGGSGNPDPAKPRAFYSVSEAAQRFGMSDMTLYRAIRAGQFPALRIRGRFVIPAQAIEAMVDTAMESGGLVDAADWQLTRAAGPSQAASAQPQQAAGTQVTA